MNGVRRAILVLYSLLLIAAAGGLTALAWNQDRKLDLNVGQFNLQAFISSSDSAKFILSGILVVVALIGVLTLVLAVLRDAAGGGKGTLRMRQADGGTLEVTTAAIENLLRGELERLPDVRTVTPRVRLTGGAVDTWLDATIDPSASIAYVTSVLAQGVANVLRDQVGVTNVRRPNVRISYDEASARKAGAAPPSTIPAPLTTSSSVGAEPPLPDAPAVTLPPRPAPEAWNPEDSTRHE